MKMDEYGLYSPPVYPTVCLSCCGIISTKTYLTYTPIGIPMTSFQRRMDATIRYDRRISRGCCRNFQWKSYVLLDFRKYM